MRLFCEKSRESEVQVCKPGMGFIPVMTKTHALCFNRKRIKWFVFGKHIWTNTIDLGKICGV